MFNPCEKKLEFATPIFLDVKGNGITFISHAHADHAVKTAEKIICSRETLELLKCRKYAKQNVEVVNSVEGSCIKLLDAGHVLGSRQLLVENGSTFLYTGDLRLTPSLTAGKAEISECDELLIECTYGSPEYVFPSRIEVGEKIARWSCENQKSNEITIIGAYALGKAQEVIAHLNQFGVTPVVPPVVETVCNSYNSLGSKLDFLSLDSQEGKEELKRSFTAVIPLSKVSLELSHALRQGYEREVKLAACSGWTVTSRRFGITGFALSDHADFNELMQFVQLTNAKKVYCVYGFAGEFAAALRGKGIDAVSIENNSKQQQLLANYTA